MAESKDLEADLECTGYVSSSSRDFCVFQSNACHSTFYLAEPLNGRFQSCPKPQTPFLSCPGRDPKGNMYLHSRYLGPKLPISVSLNAQVSTIKVRASSLLGMIRLRHSPLDFGLDLKNIKSFGVSRFRALGPKSTVLGLGV